jgi:hypothetical protein
VTQETPRKLVAASPRRSTTGNQRSVDYVLPVKLAAVIETPLIEELPEKLYRGLGAVELKGRHIDVVDEDGNRLVGS